MQKGETFTIEPDVLLGDDDHVAVMGTGDFNVRPPTVTVQGQVASPGTYALLSTPAAPDTVYQLLKRAGDLLPDGNARGIVLYRLPDTDAGVGQVNDVNQVMKAFNREAVGTKSTISADVKSSAMSGSLSQQFSSIFSGAGR